MPAERRRLGAKPGAMTGRQLNGSQACTGSARLPWHHALDAPAATNRRAPAHAHAHARLVPVSPSPGAQCPFHSPCCAPPQRERPVLSTPHPPEYLVLWSSTGPPGSTSSSSRLRPPASTSVTRASSNPLAVMTCGLGAGQAGESRLLVNATHGRAVWQSELYLCSVQTQHQSTRQQQPAALTISQSTATSGLWATSPARQGTGQACWKLSAEQGHTKCEDSKVHKAWVCPIQLPIECTHLSHWRTAAPWTPSRALAAAGMHHHRCRCCRCHPLHRWPWLPRLPRHSQPGSRAVASGGVCSSKTRAETPAARQTVALDQQARWRLCLPLRPLPLALEIRMAPDACASCPRHQTAVPTAAPRWFGWGPRPPTQPAAPRAACWQPAAAAQRAAAPSAAGAGPGLAEQPAPLWRGGPAGGRAAQKRGA